MPTLKIVSAIAILWLASLTAAEAKHHHYRSGGSCDGIHRCICGSTQARHFGFPRIYNGHNLWQAIEWAHAFPRTSIHAGAVGVKPHHVYRVVQPLGSGRALVADERGTYERYVGGDIFVDPNGNGVGYSPTKLHKHHRMATTETGGRWNAL